MVTKFWWQNFPKVSFTKPQSLKPQFGNPRWMAGGCRVRRARWLSAFFRPLLLLRHEREAERVGTDLERREFGGREGGDRDGEKGVKWERGYGQRW